jgi:hypothetical protein
MPESSELQPDEVEGLGEAIESPEAIPFGELVGQQHSLPSQVPTVSPAALPFHELDPEAFERLVAEVVSRRDHRGVQFYGRRGQKQYGLDVVEHEPSGERSLYQVKRYQVLTPSDIEDAVTDYAVSPNSDAPRRFNPRRFVVVTSADFDADTANVDKLADLRKAYAGDLELEVWGAESLNRQLRDFPRVVYAVFGPAWAKAYCGYEPSPGSDPEPVSWGLVKDPVLVLKLQGTLEDAIAAEGAEPSVAASLYRTLADALAAGGFPGHGDHFRRQEARLAEAAGDMQRAFDVMWGLASQQVEADEEVRGDLLQELQRLAASRELDQAKATVLVELAEWAERGLQLPTVVEALTSIAAVADRDMNWLCCRALEAAVADGLFDFRPADFGVVVASDEGSLDRLLGLAAGCSGTPDRMLAARLQAAIADAALTATSSATDVEMVFGPLTQDATAGRYLEGGGLICARAARQFAKHGDPERSRTLFRQAIILQSEAGYFGDVRGSLRSLFILHGEVGEWPLGSQHKELIDALPNRRTALQGRSDPMFAALEAAQNQKLPDAKSDARRALRREVLSGHLGDEFIARVLLADVLCAAGYNDAALEQYVLAGDGKRASEIGARGGQFVDVRPSLTLGLRRSRSAGIRALRSQARLVPDDQVKPLIDILLEQAAGLWSVPYVNPHPEKDAVEAIAAFGVRIPDEAVDRILALSEPIRDKATRVDDAIVRLLLNTYHALPERRAQVGELVAALLKRSDVPHNLWGFVRNLEDTTVLRATVRALAEEGNGDALVTLAAWNDVTPSVQGAARSACASLLRLPSGGTSLSNTPQLTVELLAALLRVEDPQAFEPADFTPDKSWSPGGILMTVAVVVDGEHQTSTEPEHAKDHGPDAAAEFAAGDPQVLAREVAGKLALMMEDSTSYGPVRVRAGAALLELLPLLAAIDCEGLPGRFLSLAKDPQHSHLDDVDLAVDLLSRFQINLGAADLPHVALLCSAAALQSLGGFRELTDQDLALGREITSLSIGTLASGAQAHLAAMAIAAVASSSADLRETAVALLAHPDDRVRAIGVGVVQLDDTNQVVLSKDPSSQVRRALAGRGPELAPGTIETLASDPDLAVRRHLLAAVTANAPEDA